MPGTQPKEGIGYELLVAAELKSAAQDTDSGTLDLRDCLVNVNPVEYPGKITGAPYSASVDITATGQDFTYLVECKSSKNPDMVLKPTTHQFLEAILEFLALQSLRENTKWNQRFVLAVNYPVGKDVRSLLQNRTSREVTSLISSLVREGEVEYGERFDRAFVTEGRLTGTLANLCILELPDRYLKAKANNDETFKRAHETLSLQLRSRSTPSITNLGGKVVQRYGRITLGCKSESDHRDCRDLVVNETLCHIKSPKTLILRLLTESKAKEATVPIVLGRQERGFDVESIHWSDDLSSEGVARTLTECFNMIAKEAGESDLLFYFVPGFFDLLILSRNGLGPKIREVLSPSTGKYVLDSIGELRGLGDPLKVELARLVLGKAYGVQTSPEVFESHEELVES